MESNKRRGNASVMAGEKTVGAFPSATRLGEALRRSRERIGTKSSSVNEGHAQARPLQRPDNPIASPPITDPSKEGIYIYCIISSGQPQSFGAPGIGERGDKLYSICAPGLRRGEDGLCAVVSHSPMQKFKMSRDNLLAHERAIEDVMKTHTVLPVRFATVAESEEKVRKILLKETERFSSLLREMEGRKELGLKAIFNSEKIYARIAEQEEIKRLKARLTAMPADKIYFQKMELGRMVEKALERERDKCRAEIMDILTPLAIDVKTAKPYGEMMILNSAFLVERVREEEFDRAVRELDEKFGALITWRYTGILPPFNFVNVEISTEDL